jgi:predicted DNA-binding transcriptional regulator YafY
VGWDHRAVERPVPPFLDVVQQAVVEGQRLDLGYVARDRSGSRRVIHPLGLAAKGPVWYLVADTDAGLRTFRVDRVTSAELTGEPVVRPEGFSLPEAWRMISEKVDRLRTPFRALAAADPSILATCRYVFGTRLGIGPGRPDGRVDVELRGHGLWPLAGEIAGFGSALEVFDPPELQAHLARLGRELSAIYGAPPRMGAR